MSENCQLVVFSNKAYNAIIRESFDKDPVETGGILLGHILDNGVWIVMEVLPPGINSIFQYAYFEYDEAFVNYLAQSVANQYKRPLDLLGLWHRHPGGMDVFSTTDDGTNLTYARQNPAGVISGLVNIDPRFRLTMYHLDRPARRPMERPDYSVVEVEVGDDIIPEEYFELRYFDGDEANLHPTVASRGRERNINRNLHDERRDGRTENISYEDSIDGENPDGLDVQAAINRGLPPCDVPRNNTDTPNFINDFFHFWRASKKKWLLILAAIVVLILGAFTFRSCKNNIEDLSSWVKSWTHKNTPKEVPQLSVDSIEIKVEDKSKALRVPNIESKSIVWKSDNQDIAIVDKKGLVTPIAVGKTKISATVDGEQVAVWIVKVSKQEVVTSSDVTDDQEKKSDDNSTSSESGSEASFSLTETSGNLNVGISTPLPLSKVGDPILTYVSSDDKIATVSPTGVITGKAKGIAKITITQEGKEPCIYTLTVN